MISVAQGGPFTDSQHERRHILGHAGLPADEGVVPDVDELVRGGQPSHHDLAAHGHMSRQGRGIGQYIVVADGAVMGDMGIGHDQVARSHTSYAATALSTTMNGRKLVADRKSVV